ncbi:ATP-binding cassette domain-containing protein, partial [Anaerotruncus rubiinfantis]
MLLLKAQKLIKTFGARTLFTIDRLEVHDHDRIGLVGANGAGKSTLLGILYGEEPYDEGLIERRCPIALIRQSGEPEGESGRRMQKELALMDSPRMSGGERTRAAIAAALSQEAPLLFADEPTTNLDLDGISVFREKLENYSGAMLLISHDRALLDSLCTSIWEIADGGLRVFPGNYTDWTVQKQRERDFAQFEYEQYRSEKTRLQAEAAVLREQARTMRKAPKRMGNSEARLHKGSRTVP